MQNVCCIFLAAKEDLCEAGLGPGLAHEIGHLLKLYDLEENIYRFNVMYARSDAGADRLLDWQCSIAREAAAEGDCGTFLNP